MEALSFFRLSAPHPVPPAAYLRNMTHIDHFEGWPIKVFATCINSSAPLYNAWAHCLCNADGSAGSYTDLARCGADCGSKKGPVSVQAQGSTLAETLSGSRASIPA